MIHTTSAQGQNLNQPKINPASEISDQNLCLLLICGTKSMCASYDRRNCHIWQTKSLTRVRRCTLRSESSLGHKAYFYLKGHTLSVLFSVMMLILSELWMKLFLGKNKRACLTQISCDIRKASMNGLPYTSPSSPPHLLLQHYRIFCSVF